MKRPSIAYALLAGHGAGCVATTAKSAQLRRNIPASSRNIGFISDAIKEMERREGKLVRHTRSDAQGKQSLRRQEIKNSCDAKRTKRTRLSQRTKQQVKQPNREVCRTVEDGRRGREKASPEKMEKFQSGRIVVEGSPML